MISNKKYKGMLLAFIKVLTGILPEGIMETPSLGVVVMRRINKVYVAFLCSWMIAGVPFGSMATGIPSSPSGLAVDAPVSVTPPGTAGLLSGVTPGNLRVPSGWTLVRATDFEGTKATGETWAIWGADVRTERAHTGSKSLGGTYSGDQSDVGWRLSGSAVGSFSEVYLSFYEYIESQALFNDEFFLARFSTNTPSFQEVIIDWFWAVNDANQPVFNGTKATLYVLPQGVRSARLAPKTVTVPKGSWVQWEIHYRPNTSGNANGFARIYKNGTLLTSTENANINGTISMSNAAIQVGGVYTKLLWMKDYPTCSVCSTAPGIGNDLCRNVRGRQQFASPYCAPTDPPLPSFKRFFDDIIVLKK